MASSGPTIAPTTTPTPLARSGSGPWWADSAHPGPDLAGVRGVGSLVGAPAELEDAKEMSPTPYPLALATSDRPGMLSDPSDVR